MKMNDQHNAQQFEKKERTMKRDLDFVLMVLIICLMIPHMAFAAKTVHRDDAGIAVPDVKSQFFCGYCHVLSYPKVIKKAYLSWKDGKHKDIGCVKCHYPPEQLKYDIPEHKKIPKDEASTTDKSALDFMNTELEVLSRLITVLNMDSSVPLSKPRLDDRSCTTSKCHPTDGKGKEGEYWTKKIEYAKYTREDKTEGIVPFVHDKHFDEKKWVEGQEVHCTTCHARETEGKHFEVTREKCVLCHFKNLDMNVERSKCSLCHQVPTKPLQKQKKEGATADEKPVTHQSLEEAKVRCEGCHLQLVQGKGPVRRERCITCHDNAEQIGKDLFNFKLMHEKHVADQKAHCFNCHESMQHKESDFLDAARNDCDACHPDHHTYQKKLLEGKGMKDVLDTPSAMYGVKTNCLTCHIGSKLVKGEKVSHGSGKACAACHTEKHEAMAKEWKDKTDEELKNTRETLKEALDIIESSKEKLSKDDLSKAMALIDKGQKYMNLVEYGGGVHNQKYSIMLLDVAMNNFEDAIDMLKENKHKP